MMDEISHLRANCLRDAMEATGGNIEKAIEIAGKMVAYILSGKSADEAAKANSDPQA